MSTAPPPTAASLASHREIKIISHTMLFYWWPVWLFGFIFTVWSFAENARVLHVPSDTKVEKVSDTQVTLTSEKNAKELQTEADNFRGSQDKNLKARQPRVSKATWMGAVFSIVLLLVIFITNVPLRGLWSVVVIITIVLVAVILAFAGVWDDIFRALGNLHIYIGAAGYLFISIALIAMWAFALLVFDRQVYIIFTPGQMRVCEEVGSGEKVYDTMGMQIERHRDDLFRHWVLGLGSGDLTVRTSGAQPHTITMPNVLFIAKKLRDIEEMQRERATLPG